MAMSMWMNASGQVIVISGVVNCDMCPCSGGVMEVCGSGIVPDPVCNKATGEATDGPVFHSGMEWITVPMDLYSGYTNANGWYGGGDVTSGVFGLVFSANKDFWGCDPVCIRNFESAQSGNLIYRGYGNPWALMYCADDAGNSYFVTQMGYWDPCQNSGQTPVVEKQFEYWASGVTTGPMPGDGTYANPPFRSVVGASDLIPLITANVYEGSSGCIMSGDSYNLLATGCDYWPRTPRYMRVSDDIYRSGIAIATSPYREQTFTTGTCSGNTVFSYPSVGGMLTHKTGCTWGDPTAYSAIIRRNIGLFPTFLEMKACGSGTLTEGGDGVLTYVTTNDAGATCMQAYDLTFQSTSGAGSFLSGANDWTGPCVRELYYNGPASTWKIDGTYSGYLTSGVHYLKAWPHCGWCFSPCETLNWPDTLELTFASTCSYLDGITCTLIKTIPIPRLVEGSIFNSITNSENMYFAAGVPVPGAPLRTLLDIIVVKNGYVNDPIGLNTAILQINAYCFPGFISDTWTQCEEHVFSLPILSVYQMPVDLQSCDPLTLTSDTVPLNFADQTSPFCGTFCAAGGPHTIQVTISE